MKTITKLPAQPCLANARAHGWNWDEFHNNDQAGYLECVAQGLLEQNDECAYTGLWLGEGTKQKIHIDHFRKKGIYPLLTFVWDNLFVAAKEVPCGADFKDGKVHGPQNYANSLYASFFSPLDAVLAEKFWYRSDGMMMPADGLSAPDKDKVLKTIEMFNLNDGMLKERRKVIIRQIQQLDSLADDEVRACMQGSGFSFLVERELQLR